MSFEAIAVDFASVSRKKLLAEIEREHRRKDRENLTELRAQIADAKRRRSEALRDAVQLCRQERKEATERAKARRRSALEELRELAKAERLEARDACHVRKADIRQGGATKLQKARNMAQEERAYQAELRRLERRAKERQRERTTAHERRSESDDEVRASIPVDLLAAFERVKRQIQGGPRQSRTEQFLAWAEEHPGEIIEAMQEVSEREIRKLLAEEKRLAKAVRSPPRRRATAEALRAVPF